MRTSFAILALVLGCISCHQKQTATGDVDAAEPIADRGERPSFYDNDNMAEYYGRCPKCQRWVKGYFGNWDYGDATGKLVGGGSGVTGECERCKVRVIAEKERPLTNDSRIVTWSLR
jgi:hypothetical protein